MPRPSEPTRARIVQAASALFYNEGIRRVSVDEVAAKAGLTKRTLYYHFKSKDDLVAAYLAAHPEEEAKLKSHKAAASRGAKGSLLSRVAKGFGSSDSPSRATRAAHWAGVGLSASTGSRLPP